MRPHFNLYYLFLEEKQRLALSQEARERILTAILEFFRGCRPRPALPAATSSTQI